MARVKRIRHQVLVLYEQAGKICGLLRGISDDSPNAGIRALKPNIQEYTTEMMRILLKVATICCISLSECIVRKIEINKQKYPVGLTKVRKQLLVALVISVSLFVPSHIYPSSPPL